MRPSAAVLLMLLALSACAPIKCANTFDPFCRSGAPVEAPSVPPVPVR